MKNNTKRQQIKKNHKLDSKTAIAIAFLPGIILMVIQGVFIQTKMYEWYFPNLDIPMHIMGGAIVAWAGWVFLRYARSVKKLPKLPFWFSVLVVVGVAIITGVLWEFYEFVHDVFKNDTQYQLGTADTMKDLANDLLGAFVLSLLVGKKLLKK